MIRVLALAGIAVATSSLAAADDTRLSVGANVSAYDQPDDTLGYLPELVGYATVPVANRWTLRVGPRLWLRGLDQAETASGLVLREDDIGAAAEVAIAYRGQVIPTFAIAPTLTRRAIDVTTTMPLADSGALDRTEWLPGLHAQLSVGLPIARGAVILEPFLRYELVPDDARLGLRAGIELAVRVR